MFKMDLEGPLSLGWRIAALLQQGYILNRLPVGAVTLDAQSRVVSFNNTAASILGETALREAVGKQIHAVHSPSARAKIEWLLRQADSDGELGAASMIIDMPGKVLQLRVVRLKDGGSGGGYCLIFYDITGLIPAPVETKPGRGEASAVPAFFQIAGVDEGSGRATGYRSSGVPSGGRPLFARSYGEQALFLQSSP